MERHNQFCTPESALPIDLLTSLYEEHLERCQAGRRNGTQAAMSDETCITVPLGALRLLWENVYEARNPLLRKAILSNPANMERLLIAAGNIAMLCPRPAPAIPKSQSGTGQAPARMPHGFDKALAELTAALEDIGDTIHILQRVTQVVAPAG